MLKRKSKALIILALVAASSRACAGVVADTLYLEARGERERGLRAVASVVYNRAERTGKTFEAVCLAPKQFSCWNGLAPKTCKIAPKSVRDAEAYRLCQTIEAELLTGKFEPLGDWTHYYNPRLCSPKWARGVEQVKIGNHNFLRTK